jgi:hypothetical protein
LHYNNAAISTLRRMGKEQESGSRVVSAYCS